MNQISKTFSSLCLAALLGAAAAPALAAEVVYTLDPGHTQVQFNWSHLGFSNPGANFDEVAGNLNWNEADPTQSSVKVSMPVESIHSHVALLDQKLKSPDFFDAAKFPAVTFASTKVERAGADGKFKVTGDLSLHGVTKPVVLDVTLNRAGMYPMLNVPALGFDASTVIKRSDFGVSMGIPYVGDVIQVHITAEAMEAVGFAKAMKAMAEAGQKK
jgi:polyisoprenoid-binding protein YceI